MDGGGDAEWLDSTAEEYIIPPAASGNRGQKLDEAEETHCKKHLQN